MTSLFWIIFSFIPVTLATFKIPYEELEQDSAYWHGLADIDIHEALHRPVITGVAKNVILFLGDGMGITVNTAGRIFKGQKEGKSGEENFLVWERLPNMALLKTYNLNTQVPDSASTATAYLTGTKANHYTVGLKGHAHRNNCSESLLESNRLKSILHWSQESGKDTGVVTTTRITHATPAATYAHSASRTWECDRKMLPAGEQARACKDIARQLVEDAPGRNIKVLLGGGILQLGGQLNGEPDDSCSRTDGRDLTEFWKQDKKAKGLSHKYITTRDQLQDLDFDETDSILGLFSPGHMPYAVDQEDDEEKYENVPSLEEMTEAAIKRLQKSENGYFLLVEGGRIDHGLHDGKPRRALEELVAFEKAVEKGMKLVDLEDTLIVVTADHSHTMTINGYPQRGNDILGVATHDKVTDNMPHTTLMFTNGPGYNFTWDGEKVKRMNVTGMDTHDKDFIAQSAVPTVMGEETHGGEDVAVFAHGPMAHLFHRVHEQTFVAHVMGYASCVGPYAKCDRPIEDPRNIYTRLRNQRSASNTISTNNSYILMPTLLFAFCYGFLL